VMPRSVSGENKVAVMGMNGGWRHVVPLRFPQNSSTKTFPTGDVSGNP
jgi:hypothetical protein